MREGLENCGKRSPRMALLMQVADCPVKSPLTRTPVTLPVDPWMVVWTEAVPAAWPVHARTAPRTLSNLA